MASDSTFSDSCSLGLCCELDSSHEDSEENEGEGEGEVQPYRFEPVAVNEASDDGEEPGETEAGAAPDLGRLQNTEW